MIAYRIRDIKINREFTVNNVGYTRYVYYQSLHLCRGFILDPTLQLNALAKSSELAIEPSILF